MNRPEKSICPSKRPMGGIITSSTSDETIFPKAAPMITPTARSTTLPRIANSLNSFNTFCLLCSSIKANGGPAQENSWGPPAARIISKKKEKRRSRRSTDILFGSSKPSVRPEKEHRGHNPAQHENCASSHEHRFHPFKRDASDDQHQD